MEKKLYRSREKKVIAGIAGGLGNYLDIDPVIIRIIIVLITIFHGVGILVYIIMWIVIPEAPFNLFYNEEINNPSESSGENFTENDSSKMNESLNSLQTSNSRIIIGVILIGLGIIFLFDKFLPFFDFELVFSVGLMALGVALIFNFFNKSEKSV